MDHAEAFEIKGIVDHSVLMTFVNLTRLVNPSRHLSFEGSGPLKRFLLILNALIFDSNVVRGMASLAAAPDGPYTRPPHSRKAASIAAFS